MSKVTSSLEVRLPEEIVQQFGIKPGDEIEWHPDGDEIRLILSSPEKRLSVEERLAVFEESIRLQRAREKKLGPIESAEDRGWTREELYDRGGSDRRFGCRVRPFP